MSEKDRHICLNSSVQLVLVNCDTGYFFMQKCAAIWDSVRLVGWMNIIGVYIDGYDSSTDYTIIFAVLVRVMLINRQ